VLVSSERLPRWLGKFDGAWGFTRAWSTVLMLMAGDAPCLVARVEDFWGSAVAASAGNPDGHWDWLRERSGVAGFAGALGLELELGGAEEERLLSTPAARRAAVLVPDGGMYRPRGASGILIMAMVVAVVSWAHGEDVSGAFISLVSFVLAFPVVWKIHRQRRRFFKLVKTLPEVPGARVVAAARPADRGMAQARLYVSPAFVVAYSGGWESWVPGPANGGISECTLLSDVVRFHVADGAAQLKWRYSTVDLLARDYPDLQDMFWSAGDLALDRAEWFPDRASVDAFTAVLDEVGIGWRELPDAGRSPDSLGERMRTSRHAFIRWGYRARTRGNSLYSPAQTGTIDITGGLFAGMVTSFLVVTGLGLAVIAPLDFRPVGRLFWAVPLAVVYLVVCFLTLRDTYGVRRWNRKLRKRVRHGRS